MSYGLRWLTFVPLVALLWGWPVEVRAQLAGKLVKQTTVKQASVGQATTRKQNDVLLSVEGALTPEDTQLDDGSLYDIHLFEGEAGQVVRILLTSEAFDTFLVLLNDLGDELTQNDDGSDGTNAEILVRLPASGQYGIIANAYDGSGRGAYQLTIERLDENALRQAEAEASRLFWQGMDSLMSSQYREALDLWQTALEIYRGLGDRKGEANSLSGLGAAYNNLEDYQQAINFYQQSLAIRRDLGDREGEALSLNNLGTTYDNLEDYQQAIDFYQQSLVIKRDLGDRENEALLLNNLGTAYDNLEDYQQAIDFHQQSLAIRRDLGDRQGEALSLDNLGTAYDNLGDYQQAIDFYQQSLVLARDLGDRQGESFSLGSLGLSYQKLGDYQQAIDYRQQRLALARDLGNRWLESIALNHLASSYEIIGNYQQAIDLYQQSLVINRDLGDRQEESASLGSLGNAYQKLGDYQQAIDYHQQSLAIAHDLGDREDESSSLRNLGIVYNSLGNYQQAIDFFQQSLAIDRDLGDRQGEALSVASLGVAYGNLGNHRQAIDFYQQSLAIERDLGDRQGEAGTLGNLGAAYHGLEDYQRAIDFYQQSLAIERDLGDRQGEAGLLQGLGAAYHDLEDYQRAIDFYQQSLAISQEIGYREAEAVSLSDLGLVYLKQEQAVLAEEVLFASASISDSLRSSELPDQDRINLFETQTQIYKKLELALALQGKYSEALEVADRRRARSFAQLVSERLSANSKAQISSNPLSFSEMQKVAEEQQSVLVEYSITSTIEGSPLLYIWVMQPTGELDFRQVPLGDEPDRLSKLVSQGREAIGVRGRGFALASNPNDSETTTDKLRELHQLMIEPIADLLPSDPEQRVVFIPQGELFLVPFPALTDESGTYLIEQHTILTAPSIQVLNLTRQQANSHAGGSESNTDLLAVGNPVMPKVWNPEKAVATQLPSLLGAEQEARSIAALFNVEALLGAEATEATVKQNIANARIIHLATHGLLEYGTPEESGVRDVPGAIALAPSQNEDGLLTSAEILELELQADLVVLSACDTGLGTITGDGIIGLSRSLIAAGASSVIVSLWSIPDAPTETLMTEFYTQMQQGQDKAQALRQAMLTTMESHSKPENWAAFTLIGEAN
jgi:CHAT domain-containing protein/uncharacterized protein HemY